MWPRLALLRLRVRQGGRGLSLACILLAALILQSPPALAAPRQSGPAPPRALLLEPFAAELGDGQSTGQEVARTLQEAGFTVTVLHDEQVTVPIMQHLSQYAFLYISTHAGPLPNDDAAVATGDTRHRRYAAYLKNDSLAEMKIARGGVYQYFDAVNGRFIRRYDGTFSAHSIVFLNTCNVLDMPLFWRYLQASGVATLISWHHHVTSGDADRAAEDLFALLAQGKTVSQAVDATIAAGAGASLVKNKIGTLSFLGDGTVTLRQASGAQGATATTP